MKPDLWLEFIEAIREARKELGEPETVWYRGHSSFRYTLTPTLHRYSDGIQKERALFVEFERSAARLFVKRDNDWETLFDMQHYGVPTRLLDWTEVLGVAVAFAVLDRHEGDQNSAVYVLDPCRLNKESGLNGVKEVPSNHFEYQNVYWYSQPFTAAHPIAIAPPYQNDRMHAQKGTFTIHGSNPQPIEDQCPDAIKKVPLALEALPGAREFLEYANLNSFTIFPDIVGMARHIKRKNFRFKPRPLYSEVGIEIPPGIRAWRKDEILAFIDETLWPEAVTRARRSFEGFDDEGQFKAEQERARQFAEATASNHGFLESWRDYAEERWKDSANPRLEADG